MIVPSISIAFSDPIKLRKNESKLIPRFPFPDCLVLEQASAESVKSVDHSFLLLTEARKIPPRSAAAGSTTAAGAIFTRTCFVNFQRPTVEVFAIGRGHCRLGLRVVVHGHEREAAGFARHPVHHEMDFVDGAVLFEQILEIVLGGLKREIAYVQFHFGWSWKN